MINTPQNLYQLSKKDVKKGTLTLLNAFYDDPFSKCFIPDDSMRKKYLPQLFEFFIKYGLNYGEVYSISDKINDISIWYYMKKVRTSFFKAICSGYLKILRNISKDVMRRCQSFFQEVEKMHSSLINYPHWYLNFLAVDPPFQGQGFGSTHMNIILRKIDREGLPCYLETFNERNVRWYKKCDFLVLKEFSMFEYRAWAMLKNN